MHTQYVCLTRSTTASDFPSRLRELVKRIFGIVALFFTSRGSSSPDFGTTSASAELSRRLKAMRRDWSGAPEYPPGPPAIHHFNVVGVVFVELDAVREFAYLSVYALCKALSQQPRQQLDVGALLPRSKGTKKR